MTKTLVSASICAALMVFAAAPAFATTGKGCLRPHNVPAGDVLNIRERPSANARIVGTIDPDQWGVIVLRGKCVPLSQPWGSRWCPVTHFDGNGSVRGFVKARHVRDNDCP